jgi:hypothetical protein
MELFRAAHSSTDGQEASRGEVLQFAATTEEDAFAAAERRYKMRPRMVDMSIVWFGNANLKFGQHL